MKTLQEAEMSKGWGSSGSRRGLAAALALAALALPGAAFGADKPCGGLEIGEGALSLGERLSLELVREPHGAACLKAVAAELQKRPGLQGVTIAARVANDKGMRDKGLDAARFAADALAAEGLPRSIISTVVPLARPDEKDGLYFAFVERRSARSVAQIQSTSGRVTAGNQLGNLRDATPGLLLRSADFVETGKGSVALVKLLDGTVLFIVESSVLRIGEVDVDADGRRNVRVNMVKGECAVLASSREGPFYMLTGSAVAGVRGTEFRMSQLDAQRSRLETLDGTVTFGGKNANLFVPRGKGSRVDHKGVPEEPRPLLVSPVPEFPLMGRASAGELLRWKPVPEAARYRVELAENAQFTKSWRTYEVNQERMGLPDTLSPGKWFWRVTPIDVDGFLGYASKIYAFETGAAPR